ncbi:hypothetical protein Trydic_g1252 [Trypoxylus dichotomus]
MECRRPVNNVLIEGNPSQELSVQIRPNLADDPLVVGPRYQCSDVVCSWSNYLGPLTSGVLILGLMNGTKMAKYIRENKSTRAYRIKGIFGLATDNYSKDGRIIEKTTYKHVKQIHLEKLLTYMQAVHQKKMFELCGVDMQSQTAYELAVQGLIRPATSKTPLIYGIRCVDFKLPEFTIEIQCVNEYETYLQSLIHEIGMKMNSSAHCTSIQFKAIIYLTLFPGIRRSFKKMTSDLLLPSQDLNFIFAEDPSLGDFVHDNMCILEDEGQEAVIPEEYTKVPSNDDFTGEYNFEVFIDASGNKNCMQYSAILNKVYIINHSKFSVDFKWDTPDVSMDFFVRAMPLYSSTQEAHKSVVCCVQHCQSTEPYNTGRNKLEMYHILRTISDQARYTGGPDCHLSVLVPLGVPQAGMDTVRHTFFFICKNSCATGINRRAVELIFTLEDNVGNIYGRRKVYVRVCSCPKRDRTKEEEEYSKYPDQPVPRGKKRKLNLPKKVSSFSDPNDTKVYPINLQIVGKKNAKAVLKFARDLMASEVLDRNSEEPFLKTFEELTNMLKSHE